MSQSQGLDRSVHPTRMVHDPTFARPVCASTQYIAIYICFDFEEKRTLYFCEVQYLTKKVKSH